MSQILRDLQGPLSLLGRIMLCAIFLSSTFANKIPNFRETVSSMRAERVPAPEAALTGAIIFLILGSVLVIVGFQARIGAGLLFIFLVLATYFFHDFWHMPPAYFENQVAHSLKNLGLGGAMLFIIANGPGAWSLDNLRRRPKPPTEALPA
jgi:putative oxidoreductase